MNYKLHYQDNASNGNPLTTPVEIFHWHYNLIGLGARDSPLCAKLVDRLLCVLHYARSVQEAIHSKTVLSHVCESWYHS